MRGEPVSAELAAQRGLSQAERLARVTGEALLRGEGAPRDHAMRLFRTELNRAHGEAYVRASQQMPDAVGTRFLLSPRHPEPDVCDMHARVNRYGLGPGVYPFGKSPWPAHPNTLSYQEVVFADEVSEANRAGAEDHITWLARQPTATQEAVVGGEAKAAALQAGLLKESYLTTPWRVLRKRYAAQGVDIEALQAVRDSVQRP